MNEETLLELIDSAEGSKDFYTKTDENLDRAAELEALGFHSMAEEIVKQIQFKDKLNRISEFNYLKITEEKIGKFLDKKVELYNANHGKAPKEEMNYAHLAHVMDYWRVAARGGGMSFMEQERQQMALALSQPLFGARGGSGFGGFSNEAGGEWWPGVFTPMSKSITISRRTCDYTTGGEIGQFLWKETPLSEYKALPPKDVLETLKIHKDRNLFDYFTIASVEHIKDPLLFGRIKNSTDRYFVAQWGEDIALEDVL